MSLDASGTPRKYIRMVEYLCATCSNPDMGIVFDHDGCLTLECPKCDSGAHVFLNSLPLKDQDTPQSRSALAHIERARSAKEKKEPLTSEELK